MTASRTAPSGRTAAVILAAGLGTRMRSRTPKVLHRLCGRPMLDYVLDAWQATADAAGSGPPIVVWSPASEAVRSVYEGRVGMARQAEPRGTGDAVRAALDEVAGDATELLVLSGDVPLILPDDLAAILDVRRQDDAAIALATVDAADPAALGRVVRSEFGIVERIVEAKDASPDELATNEVNAGLYAFDVAWLRRRIRSLEPSPATGELYLTDLIALARADGRLVSAIEFEDDGRFDGINDRAQLAQAEWALRVRLNERHLRAGVTMRDPSTAYVDWDVELGEDVVLEPNVILRGATRVGPGTTIGAGSQLVDTTVGAGCVVWASILEASTVEDGARIGPFAHLRPGSHVGPDAEVGNFAELKNTRLGRGVKQHHVSYLGDADLGDGTNVGAGTITANFDGRRKHRTSIGRAVFLGVDTMIVAPLEIGDGAKTGAGAVVTRNVPAGKLAVGVPARIREPRATPGDPGSATWPSDAPGSATPGQPAGSES
jgi:bifunctional UDP-N-acetylglucosamine pyrophosphorylase/glucosamine-1-phosphate N-acetyltransferase